MSVFDGIVREDMAVPLPDETQFAYLNRSARKLVGQAYERTNGERVSALLKLPAAWPEEEAGEF